jgi:thiol-disulfide isomerase/thioredoxin
MKKFLALVLACAGFVSFASAQAPAAPTPAPAPTAARKSMPGPKVGELAPDFTVYGPDGREVKLSDFRGKIVLLDIWATWCGPCVAAMPHNSEMAEKYAADGLVILAVCASDTRENYDAWVQRNSTKFKFLTAHDRAGKDYKSSIFATTYGVSIFPSLFVIDREGKIVGRAAGGGANENPRVTRLLAKAGLPIPTDHLPPETAPAPKTVPMMGLGAAPAPANAATAATATPTMRFANMAAGETVPDFSTTDVSGKPVKLSDFKGKTVFISFWTGGRNPPADVAALHAAYAAQGLSVWAINTATERADFEKWAKENTAAAGPTVSWDPAGKAVMEAVSYMIFGAGMYPAYCVVGADGKLVGGVIGMGPRVTGLLREIVGRAGIKLTAADQKLVDDTLATIRNAPAPAAVAGGMMAPAQKAAGAPEPKATLAAGAVAPDFTMRTVDDRELKLSDFKGKVVILDFWATWCGPCIASFPHTQEIAKKYKDQDVIVLASGTSDTIAKFKEWIPKNSPKYPDMIWAFDPNERGSATFEERASSKHYGVQGIPTQFVIGRDGKITGVIVGNGGKDDARTEAALAAAGVKVDPATLAKGQEQIAKAAAADRERAEAAKIPRPPFYTGFGKLKAGERPGDVTVNRPDGTPAQFSTFAPGRVLVLGLWVGQHGPGDGYLAAWRTWSAKYPDVAFAALTGFSKPEDTQAWLEKNKTTFTSPLYVDPAGAPPRPAKSADEMTDEETAAFRSASRAHYENLATVKLAGVMPPVPSTVVFDAEGRLIGWTVGFGPKFNEAMSNLLLRAGVKLAAGDQPERAWSDADIDAATPKPEPRREMLKIGAMAPDFTSQTRDGKTVKLSDFKGQVVILDFWATWCGPCMAAMPHTQEVAKHYKEQGVVVLANCTNDTRAKFEDWVARNQATYPDILWTHDAAERKPERASAKLYGVAGIPTQFIIDRTGKIVDIVIGYQKGEVILDAALAKAGINVAPDIVERGAKQLKLRGQ